MIRTELREHIFKLLFQEEFNREEDMQEHLKYYFMTLENAADKDKDYIQEKYEAVAGHIAEIDELINQYAKGWKTTRMNKVDLAILRLAVYEMKWDGEVPVGVAINEAVELAKCFGSEESGAFVNGILGKIANPDKKVAAKKSPAKSQEKSPAKPKSGFKVKDSSKTIVVVNSNVRSKAPENKNE